MLQEQLPKGTNVRPLLTVKGPPEFWLLTPVIVPFGDSTLKTPAELVKVYPVESKLPFSPKQNVLAGFIVLVKKKFFTHRNCKGQYQEKNMFSYRHFASVLTLSLVSPLLVNADDGMNGSEDAEAEGALIADCCEEVAENENFSEPLSAEEKMTPEPSTICGVNAASNRIGVRHIEANGIGYNQGYTTFEAFLSPLEPWGSWTPFLDLRGHIFNNGQPAFNTGLGARKLTTSQVWGINAYYDYRKTNHQHYNQFSVGLECLGRGWDFRINGYLPVGNKRSGFFNTSFSHFEGHYAFISQKREFAMKGINAEAGAHVNFANCPLYFATGPYYLEGEGKVAWGGQVRAAINVFDYVRIEGNTSYDSVFKWIGQGQISVNIPLGRRQKIQRKNGNSCPKQIALAHRTLQPVDRFEIIPVDRKHRRSVAIDPLTGQPYFFWFVNNLSHSAGTFESPFNTLVAAQNASSAFDIIYVFPGDGTSTGMQDGISLADFQKLWGAGNKQLLVTTQGNVMIPAFASSMPFIQNTTAGNPAVTTLSNNEISGIHLQASPTISFIGVVTIEGANCSIHDNVIDLNAPSVFGGSGISTLASDLGNLVIANNTILAADSTLHGNGMQLSSSNGNIAILNNVFSGVNASSAFQFALSILQGDNGTTNCTISGNVFNPLLGTTGYLDCIVLGNTTSTGTLNAFLEKNIMNVVNAGIECQKILGTGPLSVFINSNVARNSPPGIGYRFENVTGTLHIVQFSNNVGTVVGP